MICAASPRALCADLLNSLPQTPGCALPPACRRTLNRTRRSRRAKRCAYGCNGGWMTARKSPTETTPKTAPKKAPTKGRALARDPSKRPQSDAAPPITGAEIAERVAGMFQRGMTMAEITELARGVSWACGAVGMFAAIQPHVPGETIDALAIESRDAFEDGQAKVSEAQIKSAAKKEQAA
jgi:hypothetical protein